MRSGEALNEGRRFRQGLFRLTKIYLFHAERDQAFAERTIAGINRQFLNLNNFPKLGRPWPEVEQNARRLVTGQHLIFYRVEDDALVILRVLDGRMDVEAELLH